jgi:hypothetical protein
MNKKLLFSVILACLMTSAVVLQVIAGATFDYGTLAGKAEDDPPPPEGAVNWVAWWDEYNGIPYEILTEDNTNCEEGVDLGYSKGIVPPMDLVNWQIQIENFLYKPRQYDPNRPDRKDPIYMVFGGLGEEFSGTLWKYTIPYWKITESRTDYGVVPIHTTEGAACPTIQQQPVFGEVRTVMFWGEPGYYHVYRSQNGSGHSSNNASNGQYLYLFSTTTDESGVGTFTDSEPWDFENWYLVIQADPATNAIIGCHSENANPTGTRVIDFKTEFDLAEKVIRLSWEKVANDVLGFNLYRSTSEDIKGEIINNGMIPMDQETFVDDDLELGEIYYYTLEIVSERMSREDIKPMPISQRAGYFFFMPLIQEGD